MRTHGMRQASGFLRCSFQAFHPHRQGFASFPDSALSTTSTCPGRPVMTARQIPQKVLSYCTRLLTGLPASSLLKTLNWLPIPIRIKSLRWPAKSGMLCTPISHHLLSEHSPLTHSPTVTWPLCCSQNTPSSLLLLCLVPSGHKCPCPLFSVPFSQVATL